MPLVLELFGGFHLFDADRRAVRVPDRRARALLAYLALAERAVPRLALAELLCPEGDEQDQRTALRQAIYVARKVAGQPDLFDSADDQIRLDGALLVSDVQSFQTAIARGDPGSLREAVELYRGPLLAGERSPSAAFEDWLSGRRSELLEQVMKASLTLAEAHEAAGEHDWALALARRALTLDPLREDARRQVMRSLAVMGQRAAALREYETGRQLLADELQVGPDDDTEALRDAISRGEETLANGPSALATSHRWAVACGVSPPVRGDWGAPWWSVAALAAVLALVTAGLAIWWYSARPQEPVTASASPAGAAVAKAVLPLPDKPSIAVLPFKNLSGNERYERLADGITEDIITDLSRFRDLFVIARNSTFAYKEKPIDVRQLARELGVQYVLEGSVQTDGDQVRVTAQLIDAAIGDHVWSERYDRSLDEIFSIQDEVTQTTAASLAGQHGGLARARREVARRKPPNNLQAYDYYNLGMEAKHHFSKKNNREAQALFRKALDLDPNFARAYVGLAHTYNLEVDMGFGDSYQESMDNWLKAARKAIALDPDDAEARFLLGWYYAFLNDHDRAVAELDTALELNPNNPDVLAIASMMLNKAGQPKRALGLVQLAIRLNPHHPDWYYGALRDVYFHNRRFEEAIAAANRRLYPNPVYDPQVRAMSHALLGRAPDAAREVKLLLEANPDYSAEKFLSDTGTYARDTELNLFLEGHRKARLPICATAAQFAKYPDMKRLPQCEAERMG